MTREEALNEIRFWAIPSEKGREVLETLIPELAESEDEKVRKEIIEVLQFVPSSMWEQAKTNYKRCFAYLEKQKDLDKMIVVSPEVWDKAINDAYENGKKDGEKQKEQKPYEPKNWPADKDNLTQEQKSAEHSAKGRRGRIGTTPEHIRKKAENFLSKMEPPYDADDICSAYETGAMENANPSWSEEDEKIYNKASDVIYYKDLNDKDEVVDSLKALYDLIARKRRVIPPYARWKPSEEQMEALNALNLHGDLSYVGQQNQLISLYQDLKNLI